jgi:hypothetical protein
MPEARVRQLRSIISLTLLTFVAACSGETGNAGNNTGGFGFDVAGDVAVLDVGGNDTPPAPIRRPEATRRRPTRAAKRPPGPTRAAATTA